MSQDGPFEKSSFLKNGATFAKEDQVWLFWGEPRPTDERPQALAIGIFDFFLEQRPKWLVYPHVMTVSRQQAQSFFDKHQLEISWQLAGPQPFQKQFDFVKGKIAEGEITKAVPYQFESSQKGVTVEERQSLLSTSLEHDQGFLYGHWNEESGFIGLSPELLFSQLSETKIQSMALAGTCQRSDFLENANQLFGDEKLADEHHQVVEDIRERLSLLGTLQVGERQALLTPHLAHLFTPFELQTQKAIDLTELINWMHPTPALGVAPRHSWREIATQLEEMESRQLLGAPFVFSLNENQCDVVVAIRHMNFGPKQLQVGAGCGVVSGSQFEEEWQELQNKKDSIKKIFGVS